MPAASRSRWCCMLILTLKIAWQSGLQKTIKHFKFPACSQEQLPYLGSLPACNSITLVLTLASKPTMRPVLLLHCHCHCHCQAVCMLPQCLPYTDYECLCMGVCTSFYNSPCFRMRSASCYLPCWFFIMCSALVKVKLACVQWQGWGGGTAAQP